MASKWCLNRISARLASTPFPGFLRAYRKAIESAVALWGPLPRGLLLSDGFVYTGLRERAQEKLEEGVLDAVLEWKAAKMEREMALE
ncbi:hypothetical protein JCM6882_002290 [Rhodosporidiobolus microsporus]